MIVNDLFLNGSPNVPANSRSALYHSANEILLHHRPNRKDLQSNPALFNGLSPVCPWTKLNQFMTAKTILPWTLLWT